MMSLKTDLDNFPGPERHFDETGQQRLVVGGGCFWCTEAVFLALDGVTAVTSGYAGDREELANYDAVCSGSTDHAEVIEIVYDSATIGLGELLKIFFSIAHDPTQVDRQGNDRGRQYRSVVFFQTQAQKQYVADYIRQLDEAGVFDAPIATTLEPLDAFYTAEAYHQDFAARNPGQPYVQFSAAPKLEKLARAHPQRLRRSS